MSPSADIPSSRTPAKHSIPAGSGRLVGSISSKVGGDLIGGGLSKAEPEASLMYTGTCAEQLKKIDILLRLTEYSKDSKEDREKYFYTAIELAQRYIKDITPKNPYWGAIINAFLHYIRPRLSPLEVSSLDFMEFVFDSIQGAGREWTKNRIENTDDLKNNLNTNGTPEEILDKFETVFGLVRLLIISEDSGVIVTQHRVNDESMDELRDKSKTTVRRTTIMPFDKTRTYEVYIDFGSIESANQIAEHHWENFIQKIINIYIERKEIEFCINQHGNLYTIKSREAKEIIPSERNDYRNFLEAAIGTIVPGISHESQSDPEYIDNLSQAIDICRIVTLQHSGNQNIQAQYIPQRIDHILGCRFNTRVLDMVKTILLSRDETMNGLGYPAGLSKERIPIEGRIYAIIRSYEAFYGSAQPIAVTHIMQRGARGGYLDSVLLVIFLQTIADDKIGIKETHTNKGGEISPYRDTLYTPHIQSWTTIMDYIGDIETQYLQHRTSGDIGKKNRLALIIKDLQFHLIQVADLMNVVVVALHGETPSDKIEGQPGISGEGLTEVGVGDSKQKGKLFRGLSLNILSSPLRRAIQTAEIICQEMRTRVDRYLLSPSVIITKALENPPKDAVKYRHGLLAKLIEDKPDEILGLIWRIISSPEESVDILVTHGTVRIYIAILLDNFGVEGSLSGSAIPKKDNIGDVHLVRGGRRIEWNLFFPFVGWEEVIHEVHMITEDIFGDTFCPADHGDIHLIHLHKKFLDYMHLKNEKSPRQIRAFINRLNKNPRTKHFSAILRKEGKIQSRKRKK